MKNGTPKKLILAASLLAMASFHSCDLFKADDPKPLTELEKLPPITQEGKNTFGCLVNGKAWVAPTQNDALAFYQQGTLSISGSFRSPVSSGIGLVLIDLENPISTGTFSLIESVNYPLGFCRTGVEKSPVQICLYEADNTLSGTITLLKIDYLNFIVSGLFEYSAELPDCEKIVVTHGRFDINYVP